MEMPNKEVVHSVALRLYQAIEKNNLSVAKDLIQRKGANPNIILPNYGIACFHLAVGIDSLDFSIEVTGLFLRYGGNPNIRSDDGLTPVHVAAIRGRLENLRLLLLAGGDPQALDNDGCSPTFYAYQEGHTSCIDMIQNYKCFYSKHLMPKLLSDRRDGIRIPSVNDKKLNTDVILKKSFVEQTSALNEPATEEKLSLATYAGPYPDAANHKRNVKVNKGQLSGFHLEKSFSKLILEEKSDLKKTLEQITEDISESNNQTNLFSNTLYNEVHDCWVASSSCFSEISESECGLDKRVISGTTQCADAVDINKVSRYNEGSNLSDVEFFGVEDQDSEYIKKGDETFVASPAVSHRTYTIANSSFDTIITDDLSEQSLVSFDCSSPVYNKLNISIESKNLMQQINIFRSYSESNLLAASDDYNKRNSFVAYRKDDWLNVKLVNSRISANSSDSDAYFTVPEEIYQYTDEEEGVILLEKRLRTVPNSENSLKSADKEFLRESLDERTSSTCTLSSCNTADVREKVRQAVSNGCSCPLGPITSTTKRVYLRRIHKFNRKMLKGLHWFSSKVEPSEPKFSRELERTLVKPFSLNQSKYIEIEQRMMAQFDGNGKFSYWREGYQKSSFNYLLLDPRLTCNLPLRWSRDATTNEGFNGENHCQYWKDFLCSIFYVGKGKRSRPYSHLYEAFTAWRGKSSANRMTKKVKHILEIWKEDKGVVCLHVFQNSKPVEAFTREAAMIDAIGINNLKNERRGDYYGIISSLGFSQKREFGAFLLYRAMLIFINEGERQIRPVDID